MVQPEIDRKLGEWPEQGAQALSERARTCTHKGNTKMATTKRRVGEYNPDIETGETLDAIENVEVEIASVAFDERRGKNGTYTLSIITLADGRIFHTGGAVVAERLAQIPSADFPVLGTFTLIKSQSNPRQSYWTVN